MSSYEISGYCVLQILCTSICPAEDTESHFVTMRHEYRKTHTYPRLNHTGWPKMVVVNFMATITILMH